MKQNRKMSTTHPDTDTEPKENIDLNENLEKEIETKSTSSKKLEVQISFRSLFLNGFVAYFFIGPCVVVFWGSTWTILTKYFLPYGPVISYLSVAAFGYVLCFSASVFQERLQNFSSSKIGFVPRHILVRVYSYVMCVACVSEWWGLWGILDYAIGKGMLVQALTCSGASLVMFVLRCHSTTVSPPVLTPMDIPTDENYRMSTFFSSKPGGVAWWLDSAFTIFFVSSLGIVVWRGMWGVIDILLVPDTPFLSALWSLVISYGLVMNLLALQVRGCPRDGELTSGQGVVFDMYYVTHLIDAYRARTTNQHRQEIISLKHLPLDMSLTVRNPNETSTRDAESVNHFAGQNNNDVTTNERAVQEQANVFMIHRN
ncbi:uncharacterized protein LOC101855226 [Aplysia californica]|uniref:Uncharacterized protein LOC101855226 n=1 Tax=Aplysia californica TaxID=6500 RepID=A0ABM0K9G7_APLCA|nr:uncharacterized protein LOC101855226 [Aplysia californica]